MEWWCRPQQAATVQHHRLHGDHARGRPAHHQLVYINACMPPAAGHHLRAQGTRVRPGNGHREPHPGGRDAHLHEHVARRPLPAGQPHQVCAAVWVGYVRGTCRSVATLRASCSGRISPACCCSDSSHNFITTPCAVPFPLSPPVQQHHAPVGPGQRAGHPAAHHALRTL